MLPAVLHVLPYAAPQMQPALAERLFAAQRG